MPSKYCNKDGQCKKSWWCAVDFDPKESCEWFEPETNGDRIRGMTDYDLADWIAQVLTYHAALSRAMYKDISLECDKECPLYLCCNDQPYDNIEDWLKMPVEVDNGEG